MVNLTRRGFLGASVTGAASMALPARAAGPAWPRRHVLPAAPRPPASSTVAALRPSVFPDLRAAVEAAVRLAGGLSFIRPGQSVLLKPAVNSGTPYPATTDPEVVAIMARLVAEAGGRPFVADRTMFMHGTAEAFRKTGIADAARQAGVPCLPLDDEDVVALSHPLAIHWPDREVPIYRAVAEADHIINLCTPRTHRLGGFTMAMKNNVGVVAGGKRMRMHMGAALRERLAEISLVTRPSLVLLDGRRGFGDGGPDQGDLVHPDVLLAGSDPLAIDAVGIAALRLVGVNDTLGRTPMAAIPMIKRAADIGIGAATSDRIRLVGLDPAAEATLRAHMT